MAAFFPAAGCRNYSSGALQEVSITGDYSPSSPNGSSNAYTLTFTSSAVHAPKYHPRTYAFSVRCVKEFILVFVTTQVLLISINTR
ncbi:MAG: hypothetical protein LBR26_17525 [Prevotella sp.]|nr:hypothetical protein [Prevotella sp.]